MTSSNRNIFPVTGHLCGEFTGPGEFPVQRPVTRSFDVFFDLCLNKRLSKQSWGWWCETLSRPLWRHRNGGLKMLLLHTKHRSLRGFLRWNCIRKTKTRTLHETNWDKQAILFTALDRNTTVISTSWSATWSHAVSQVSLRNADQWLVSLTNQTIKT